MLAPPSTEATRARAAPRAAPLGGCLFPALLRELFSKHALALAWAEYEIDGCCGQSGRRLYHIRGRYVGTDGSDRDAVHPHFSPARRPPRASRRRQGAGQIARFDNMDGRAPKGMTDWQDYSIVLDVPADATRAARTNPIWCSTRAAKDASSFASANCRSKSTSLFIILP